MPLHSSSSTTQANPQNGQQNSLHSAYFSKETTPKNRQQLLSDSYLFSNKSNSRKGATKYIAFYLFCRTSSTKNGQKVLLDVTTHDTNEQSTEKGPSTEKKKRDRTQMQSVHGRTERKLIMLNEHNQSIGPTIGVVQELNSFLAHSQGIQLFTLSLLRHERK
ncbi:hypothetical protein P3S68_031515 [Capsicum galapagoense]